MGEVPYHGIPNRLLFISPLVLDFVEGTVYDGANLYRRESLSTGLVVRSLLLYLNFTLTDADAMQGVGTWGIRPFSVFLLRIKHSCA